MLAAALMTLTAFAVAPALGTSRFDVVSITQTNASYPLVQAKSGCVVLSGYVWWNPIPAIPQISAWYTLNGAKTNVTLGGAYTHYSSSTPDPNYAVYNAESYSFQVCGIKGFNVVTIYAQGPVNTFWVTAWVNG